jgi:predicted nucleotidyltransferase
MTPAELIQSHGPQLRDLCQRYNVRRLDLFGSAARDDFDERRSDVDLLVEFVDLTVTNAADRYLGLMVDLEDLLGRPVDLVSATSIRNPYFREELQRTRVPLYAA